tara:strand:- start:104 stop:343 length:240 start_codon:yes stop_codon:yes gene_type:complete
MALSARSGGNPIRRCARGGSVGHINIRGLGPLFGACLCAPSLAWMADSGASMPRYAQEARSLAAEAAATARHAIGGRRI